MRPPPAATAASVPAEDQKWDGNAAIPSQVPSDVDGEISPPGSPAPGAKKQARIDHFANSETTDDAPGFNRETSVSPTSGRKRVLNFKGISFGKSFHSVKAASTLSRGQSEEQAGQEQRRDIFGAQSLQSHRAFEPGFAAWEGQVGSIDSDPERTPRPNPVDVDALGITKSGRFCASQNKGPIQQGARYRLALLCDRFLKLSVTQIFMVVLTMGVLFVGDFIACVADVSYDRSLIVILWLCVVFFGVEWIMQVLSSELQEQRYNCSLFFFLDIIATLTIAIDIFVLEGNNLSDNGPIARAARAARIGTRAGRSVRLLRLLRFLRLVRITRFIKVLLHYESKAVKRRRRSMEVEAFHEKQIDDTVTTTRADTIGAQIGATTTRKVVIMTLLLLLVLPVLSPDTSKQVCNAELVEFMKALHASVGGNCSALKTEVSPWFNADFVPFSRNPESGLTRGGLIYAQVEGCVLYADPVLVGLEDDREQSILAEYRRGTEIQALPCDALFSDRDGDDVDDRSPTHFLYDHRAEEVETSQYAMGFTAVVIVTLLGFSLIFSQDAENFANELVAPISQLMEDMTHTSKLRLDMVHKEDELWESRVYEVRKLQAAFVNLHGAVGSFAKFTPLEVVKHFLSIGSEAKLGVSQRNVTIFFSDIVDFAVICETTSPKEVLSLLAEYFERMVGIIVDERGTMLEFIGDAILAIWNAPNSVPDHAVRACTSALRMTQALEDMRAQWEQEKKPALRIRCGLHSADVFVGNLGSKMRMKYGVLGDGVNLASRLEGLNNRYQTDILISEDVLVQPAVKDTFLVRPLDRVVVKGRAKATPIYEVLDLADQASDQTRSIAQHSANVMQAYLGREFDQAIASLDSIRQVKRNQDPAGDVLRSRCLKFLERPPPPEWDGAEVLNQKTF